MLELEASSAYALIIDFTVRQETVYMFNKY